MFSENHKRTQMIIILASDRFARCIVESMRKQMYGSFFFFSYFQTFHRLKKAEEK
jgi:hypothetical protein